MKDGIGILRCALDGWLCSGDIEKYVNLEDIKTIEPTIYEAYKEIQAADRKFVLLIKGAIQERESHL